ncbi:hypothetical protein [Methylorubrum sp. DB1722]|uniref:hypothetical protein n=1 Tax=Methylorubrum sp. DB1722 TaxID=2478916 RepID=UPI0018E394BB|nr:hypothetical protein [Methylorubrum sp. DB1722]MBI1689531.1 hypothetical protein [Methylorubrum sp. DB1722]
MAAIFKPLAATGLLKPAGQCALKRMLPDNTFASGGATPFGHATVNFKKSATKSEIRTPEDPNRGIVGVDYSELSGSFDIEFSNLNRLGVTVAFQAKVQPYQQQAVAERTQTFKDVVANEWMELTTGEGANARGVVSSTVTAVKVDNVALPASSYRHDRQSGIVQLLTLPDGADMVDVTITFSALLVSASTRRDTAQLLQETVVRGRYLLRQNNLRGTNRKIVVPILGFGGDSGGDVQLIADSNDVVKVTASGTIEADYAQDPGYEYGWTVDLVDDAPAEDEGAGA